MRIPNVRFPLHKRTTRRAPLGGAAPNDNDNDNDNTTVSLPASAIERTVLRKSSASSSHRLILGSLLYASAVYLDRTLLVSDWKYRHRPTTANNDGRSNHAGKTAVNDAIHNRTNAIPSVPPVPPSYERLSSSTTQHTGTNAKSTTETCRALLAGGEYPHESHHAVVSTHGAPPPLITLFALPESMSVITRRIVRDGYWERHLVRALRDLLQPVSYNRSNRVNGGDRVEGRRPKKLFLDVGANVGIFSLYAQALGANVIAVEAMPTNAAFIRSSECLNFVSKRDRMATARSDVAEGGGMLMPPPGDIYLFNYAAHPFPGENCHIHSDWSNKDDGSLICSTKKKKRHSKATGTSDANPSLTRLDAILHPDTNFPPSFPTATDGEIQIDLMKIDVEGFEQAVMESASNLARPPLRIIFECDRRQALSKGHDTLFWRRYLSEHRDVCNGFTFAVESDGADDVRLMLPYLPFVDAIVLGTCNGGNFYMDCSGKMGEGIGVFLYRWSVHLCVFLFGFVRGSVALYRGRRNGWRFYRDVSSTTMAEALVLASVVTVVITCLWMWLLV